MPDVPSLPGAAKLGDRVANVFESGGLARSLPSFEVRPAQRGMAEAVSKTFEDGGVLLVEAGTGTGKTLAYLVPAILSGERVLLSTGTKNLQEQIYFKDLDILRDALGVPFTATYMKGRGNYLCLHRFESFRASAEGAGTVRLFGESAVQVFLPILEKWAEKTETGDRAEIADLPEDLPFWGEIAATSENCIGTECPQYQNCFVTRMRQRAAESNLVVVNHHLLCADAAVRQSAYGEVIPECHYAVVDEAHQLEDVATQYFGVAVSNYRFDDLVRDGERMIHPGMTGGQAADLQRVLDRLTARAHGFFGLLQQGIPVRSSQASESRVRVTSGALEPVYEEGALLMGALDNLEATAGLIRVAADTARTAGEPAPQDPLSLSRRAGELRDSLRFVMKASDPDYVYFLESRGRGLFLRAAPIDVSPIVREVLIDRMKATVLTSATLTVDGSFDYIRGRLGLNRPGATRCVRLSSEFDYAKQAILYLPRKMPDPRSPDFTAAAAREVLAILERSEGRAFVLFTSYAAMRAVQAIAELELRYPILVQGNAPRSALLQQFRTTPNAVLFATSSFWQGVDVMGEALSCVIIDKLPFASPGDPITAARIEAIANRGGQPFGDYQVPLAILALLQGLGRLIRHRDDRGVLAILDPRLRTMGYGKRFLASLPPATVIRDVNEIGRFFGRK
ncbi:MAG TPA: ATP-dependent DNA helicase [Vicinamibacterales bacterium]|nr:ATP-dependent DNA helicase [Vicinamibacterales bacterium]